MEDKMYIIVVQETHTVDKKQLLKRGYIRECSIAEVTFHRMYGIGTYIKNYLIWLFLVLHSSIYSIIYIGDFNIYYLEIVTHKIVLASDRKSKLYNLHILGVFFFLLNFIQYNRHSKSYGNLLICMRNQQRFSFLPTFKI